MSVVDAASYLKDATIGAGNVFRDTVVRFCLSFCTVVALVWVAVLMYISFYYAYMPTVHYTQPVYLQFSTDCNSRPREGLCSFPEANVSLSKGERILMRGQKYQVFLDLDMPYSPVNERLGMFMVNVNFLSNSGKVVATSSKSCMLHFRSAHLKVMYSVFMALPLIFGFTEEKQSVPVKLFENYVDDSYHPVTSVKIIIMAKHVEIYGALLRIEAQFSGLRFILFNWPITSALVCISANFIVICIIFFFAYNAFTPEPVEQSVIEAETEEDGQERLYSEARRRDLGSSVRRRPRSPVRITSASSAQENGGKQMTFKQRLVGMWERLYVVHPVHHVETVRLCILGFRWVILKIVLSLVMLLLKTVELTRASLGWIMNHPPHHSQ
ncbi:seipin-like isoform X2 [Actinia tenebrosa]|uniref:Seipin n=1 Tax=Actinia tenebrosa TaxID=6105 RepID=A0A6P8IL58_ACTTE|nr:seipin-like isoform X2 [Actinia tenebrosa]